MNKTDDNLLDDMNKNTINLHKVLTTLNDMVEIVCKELEKLTVRVTELERMSEIHERYRHEHE